MFRASERGELAAQSEGEEVSFEFNSTHAAIFYVGRDNITLRPYFLSRPAESQDLGPFSCGECGVQLGDQDEYLSRFVSRENGFRLFEAVLAGRGLPDELPDSRDGQPMLPGFGEAMAERSIERSLEWRPLTSGERDLA